MSIQGVSFVVSLNISALILRKPATAGIFRESYSVTVLRNMTNELLCVMYRLIINNTRGRSVIIDTGV
jgi:hypothetical protein